MELFVYVDVEEGVIYVVDEFGIVSQMYYSPDKGGIAFGECDYANEEECIPEVVTKEAEEREFRNLPNLYRNL